MSLQSHHVRMGSWIDAFLPKLHVVGSVVYLYGAVSIDAVVDEMDLAAVLTADWLVLNILAWMCES